MRSARSFALDSISACQHRNVEEWRRTSTATSNTSPRRQLTILPSACGGRWKCMPRTAPFVRVRVTLIFDSALSKPAAADSSAQYKRERKPLESSIRRRWITNRPWSGVGKNSKRPTVDLGAGREVLVNLTKRHLAHVPPRAPGCVPFERAIERRREAPTRPPGEAAARLAAVNPQGMTFMRLRGHLTLPGHGRVTDGQLGLNPRYRLRIVVPRAEVPCLAKPRPSDD